MSRLKGTATAAVHWVGAEIAPIVLLPLAAVLVWVSVWKVWLPSPDAGTPSRRSVAPRDRAARARRQRGGDRRLPRPRASDRALAQRPHRGPDAARARRARRARRAPRPEGRVVGEGRRGDP